MDYNSFRSIPDVLCSLTQLSHLSCSDNDLDATRLYRTVTEPCLTLMRTTTIDRSAPLSSALSCSRAHQYDIGTSLGCGRPPAGLSRNRHPGPPTRSLAGKCLSATVRPRIPLRLSTSLACSLKRLYLGDNQLEDTCFIPETIQGAGRAGICRSRDPGDSAVLDSSHCLVGGALSQWE